MGLIRYSCGHISGPHEPLSTKFVLWRFFIMLYRYMVFQTLKCKKSCLLCHHFGTLYNQTTLFSTRYDLNIFSPVYAKFKLRLEIVSIGFHLSEYDLLNIDALRIKYFKLKLIKTRKTETDLFQKSNLKPVALHKTFYFSYSQKKWFLMHSLGLEINYTRCRQNGNQAWLPEKSLSCDMNQMSS